MSDQIDGTTALMGGDIGALAKALAAAQGEMDNAVKDGNNPHFGSRFATLASVREVVQQPLSKHGLALTQHPSAKGGVVTLRTMLMHEGGGWIASEATASAKDAGPQSIGSAISYLRRYSLAALCGIAQEDDDAESATSRTSQPAAKKAAPKSNGAQNGNGGQPWDKVMPFGKTKGTALGEHSEAQLRSTIEWCEDKDAEKWADLIAACHATLNRYAETAP